MEQGVRNAGGARQRILRTEEQILALLEEYKSSGFSPKEFCELSDVSDATFYGWLKKYGIKTEGEERGGFATIELVPPVQSKPQLFAEIGNIKLYREVSAEYLKALLS